MRIYCIAVGERMPSWVSAGYDDYRARLPREWGVRWLDIAPADRRKNPAPQRWRQQEGERILAALPAAAHAIALERHGQQWDSVELASQLARWQHEGRAVAFVIGGADGLAPEVLARCAAHWSLSRLTFPHALVRILLAEQLFRAWSILQHHPYHRA